MDADLIPLIYDGGDPCPPLPPDQLLMELRKRAMDGDAEAISLLEDLNGEW